MTGAVKHAPLLSSPAVVARASGPTRKATICKPGASWAPTLTLRISTPRDRIRTEPSSPRRLRSAPPRRTPQQAQMAALGTLPGAAAASVPQRQRRRGAPLLAAAYVPEGARLVCGRQLRPAPVLASPSATLSGPARRRFLRAAPAAAAASGSASAG